MKDKIKNLILLKLGIDITEKSRKREIVEARALFFYIMKRIEPKTTYTELGNYCNILHCSVIYALKNYETYEKYNYTLSLLRHYILENYNLNLQSDETLKEQIIELKEKLNKNQFNYGILKKINNLLIESKGTQKEEFLVARLNSFYDINSKVQIH